MTPRVLDDPVELDELGHYELGYESDVEDEEPGGTRSLVRLLAMAATVLIISFLVVNRSTDALNGKPGSGGRFTAGHVSLVDDDTDQSLFDVPSMAPGDEHANCIAVTYGGSLDRPVVAVAGKADGALARALRLTVEVGQGGGFGDCAGFMPEGDIFSGTLADFTAAHPPGKGLAAFRPEGPGDERTFRFRFVLDDAGAAQGADAAVDFDWTVENS
jgi:hypothetical protein